MNLLGRFLYVSVAIVVLCGVFAGPVVLAAAPRVSTEVLYELRSQIPPSRGEASVFRPVKEFQAFTADIERIKSILAQAPAPRESSTPGRTTQPVELSLPMPRGGRFSRFAVEQVAIMHPDLSAKYPEIKTYRGKGLDDPAAILAFDVTPEGMHAQIRTGAGAIYIDPYYRGNDRVYVSYFKSEVVRDKKLEQFICETLGDGGNRVEQSKTSPATSVGPQLRTYRLACAANSTFTSFTGNTVASGLAAIVVVMNRVSAIYETDVGIRMQLIPNNDWIVYPTTGNPVTGPDPYTNGTAALSQNQTNLDNVISSANYDVGHVFTTGSGGVAGLGVVCRAGQKARGTTGLGNPIGDPFNVDYVAHEMGHEFGANHPFNGTGSNCSGSNRSGAHAYEPGSGTTIMAYAGICGANDNLAPNSDAYFLFESIAEIVAYTTTGLGAGCPVITSTGNNFPAVTAGPNYTIPSRTPFTLTGSAVDPDGDTVTYCWEERDLGPAQAGNVPDNGSSPIFRSFFPTYTPTRVFPKIANVVAGIFDNVAPPHGETLPITNRTLNFRLTARDNRIHGGGVNTADMMVAVVENGAGFSVTAPNTSGPFVSGSNLTVTWNVAGTSAGAVNTANVKISLSTDGGYTYLYTLLATTPNDGSETVTLPAGVTSSAARIKVEAVGNIFFALSPINFAIN